jgi:glycosyltransferase involved in cell wall biosynthesis
MRVAFVTYEFPPDTVGGIGTYAWHAARMLSQAGHSVTVFAGTDGSVRREIPGAVHVTRLPCDDRRSFHAVATPAFVAAHAAEPFDVAEVPDLYADGEGLRPALPSLPIVLRAHTPSFVAHRIDFEALPAFARLLSAIRRMAGGVLQRQPMRELLRECRARVHFSGAMDRRGDRERNVAMEADVVSAPSRKLGQVLVDEWGIAREKLRILRYVHLPASELLALPPPRAARSIAFHGGVRYFKGVHVLMRAMIRIVRRHPDVRLVVAGATGTSPVPNVSWAAWRADRMVEWRDTLEWLRPEIDALGPRVHLAGFVPPDRLPGHLAAADICVFPSLFDNFPNACLEAMSAARPIIGTRSGGMEEMLSGGAGLLVDPGSVPQLVAAIERLLGNEALRSRLADNARRKLLSEYSSDAVLPLHEQLYREAIESRSVAGQVRREETAANS